MQSAPTLRLAVKLLLLTRVRKSELTDATWDEINFTSGVWTIPAQRMKRSNSEQRRAMMQDWADMIDKWVKAS